MCSARTRLLLQSTFILFLVAYRGNIAAKNVAPCAAGEGFSCACLPSTPSSSSMAAALAAPGLGTKRILLYRVDFSDFVGAAIPSNTAATLIADLNGYYSGMSYGLMNISLAGMGSVVTETLRLPEPSTAYDNKFEKLIAATREVAATAGHQYQGFDFDIVCTGAKPFLIFGAVAYVGGPGLWVGNSNFNVGVVGHEMGHNLGLPHASFWSTGDLSAIGPGKREEYGDPFDSMGVPGTSTSHFNTRFKNYLGWIPDSDVPLVTSNGTYRINAHDRTNAVGLRALQVARTAAQNYWIEFRNAFNNRWITNGVTFRWATANIAENTLLIDATPGTPGGKNDSPLVIGRTFSDRCLDLHITPVAKLPDALDVVINRGPFPTNVPPSISISAGASEVGTAVPVTFQATATDANGDALAYYWDFGDGGNYGPNQPGVQFAWPLAGEYVVRCTASDMKGGTASDSVIVRVGNITTFTVTGVVRRDGEPVEGALIKSGSRFTYTDTDGSYRLTRLAAGRQPIAGVLDGFTLVNGGFENPVIVGPSVAGADLVAIPEDLNALTLISTGAVWKYLDNGNPPPGNWTRDNFDDSAWQSGRAKLGYGGGDERTVVSFGTNGANRYITTWFRHKFVVNDISEIDYVALRLRRDDGAIVHLNGDELCRENMPSGLVSSVTTSIGDANSVEEATFFKRLFPGSRVQQGTNIVAVEVHQAATNSVDLSFDLDLVALTRNSGALRAPVGILRAETEYLVRWPAAYAGWIVAGSPLLAVPPWGAITNSVVESNGWNMVRVPHTTDMRFFQLLRPGFCP